MSDADETRDPRPWRKRHPVLSRTLLYGLGLGLAAVLFVLFTERKADDESTRIEALQKELDGLSILLATDASGDVVLKTLHEKFSGTDLPLITRGRVLRWRAMAWRRKASVAEDPRQRDIAHDNVESALRTCAALDLEPAERAALHLEWAEARLERQDVPGAYEVLRKADGAVSVPLMLLKAFLDAQAVRLKFGDERAARKARAAATQAVSLLQNEDQAYVGGRTWNPVQVTVELANFATTVGDAGAMRAAWNALRAAAPRDFDVQTAAAVGLIRSGARDDALSAWRAAKAANADLAAAEARRRPELRDLDAILSQR